MYVRKSDLFRGAVVLASVAVVVTVLTVVVGRAFAENGRNAFFPWLGDTTVFHGLDWTCKVPTGQPKVVVCRRLERGASIGISLTPTDLQVWRLGGSSRTLLYTHARNP
jgi:hypothetical protein